MRAATIRDGEIAVAEHPDPEPEAGLCLLPEPSKGDLFLDFEGDPFGRPESNGAASCCSVRWVAAAAFQIRAPSRCKASPRSRATAAMASIEDCGKTRPPARLWVFSSATTRGRGM